MSDNFQIEINNMVVFDSRWLDPEDPLYFKYKGKLVRNPDPPDYFIDTLPQVLLLTVLLKWDSMV